MRSLQYLNLAKATSELRFRGIGEFFFVFTSSPRNASRSEVKPTQDARQAHLDPEIAISSLTEERMFLLNLINFHKENCNGDFDLNARRG